MRQREIPAFGQVSLPVVERDVDGILIQITGACGDFIDRGSCLAQRTPQDLPIGRIEGQQA